MKINKLDYVRTEEFSIKELVQVEHLFYLRGYNIGERVTRSNREEYIQYGVDKERDTMFYDLYFDENGGKDITEEVKEYLSKTNLAAPSDLKDGMVVTFRRGDKALVFKGKFYSVDDPCYATLTSEKCISISESFEEDFKHESYTEYDLIHIEYMEETLWERVEESSEQKRAKELQKIIEEAQEELRTLK